MHHAARSFLRARTQAFALAVAAVAMAVLPQTAEAAERTRYPLTLENCGSPVTFERAPRRVVSIGQSSTEILLSLGLADRMVGTAVWFSPVVKRFEAENARIERLADNDPSFESVLSRTPDLVTAQFEWHVGPNGSVAKREQFGRLGVATYLSPADCAKDNASGGDGVRRTPFTMDLVHREIRELAAIFDVAERGEALIASLEKREADAVASVRGIDAKDVSALVWFSSREVRGDAFVAGRNGVPAYLLTALGARNVITTDEEWPLTGWESIAAANPTVIIMAEMSRRRFAADDTAAKLRFLESDPVAGKLDAVRNRRFILLDVEAMHPSIRAVDGIEAIAAAVERFGLMN
ncbi:ABC transporter substrate-binding protein [Azospirillum sp. SYSU D00513]|uniref:ABC transporter substrate-binding protein n=1 Tax=Azospirillum sp. SYSU D00513 TaxID=2812561 RepID=UPI001FFF87E9|nr:ABC transporter substrate-binding protein [Azospirillum sp. SYSU D00513]